MFKNWRHYLFLLTLVFIIIFFAFKLWQHPINLPFAYQSDSYLEMMMVKNQLSSGKFYYSNQLSLPGEQSMLDFPMTQAGLFSISFLFSLISKNIFVVFNLFYLSGFFLAAFTSYFTFLKLDLPAQAGIKNFYAFWGAILFTFLPYHFAHGAIHSYLSHYWVVPLAFLFAKQILFNQKPKKIIIKLFLIGALIASTGIYYAYFSCLLVLCCLLILLLQKQFSKPKIFLAGSFLLVISLSSLLQLAPNFKFWWQNGRNELVGQRSPHEAEMFGLKPAYLLIPINNQTRHFFKNQEEQQYLGLAGLAGLLIATLIFFDPPAGGKIIENKSKFRQIKIWYYVLVLLILLSLNTGGATIISHLITAQIRAYGRIIPFINFTCFLILFYFLAELEKKIKFKKLFFLLINLFFIITLLDQLRAFLPLSEQEKIDFYQDQQFIKEIEAKMSTNARIYQLPYKDFPETPNLYKLGNYDLLKGYLHSPNLAWSYASLKGRWVAYWQWDLYTKDPQQQLKILQDNNFDGLYIDKYGYADEGKAIEASFSALLKQNPITSDNNRLIFYDLTNLK